MTLKTIPERHEITCDICRQQTAMSKSKPSTWTTLKLIRDALDYSGAAVADGSVSFDCCPECASKIVGAINAETEAIRLARIQGDSHEQ